MKAPSAAGTLPNLEAFCRTYEAGSFTRAARALSVTPQATSRSVARLEAALGVTLFRRTTRSLAPTDAARRYYDVCVHALSLLSSGEREIASGRQAPEGKVRISVPTTYGLHRLLPSFGAFRERYPRVQVEVNVSSENVDFVRGGFDLAIRVGPIKDQSMVARRLGMFPIGVFASPTYLARAEAPRTPADLARHHCIGFVLPSSGKILPWSFVPGPKDFVPSGSYLCSGDVLGNVTLARAGAGLVQIYDFMVAADVARGTLVEVLTAFRGVARPFSLLYPKAVVPSRAVRAMIDFVTKEVAAPVSATM
jgi:DNA-binding transcriptional LysR family regulator